MMFEREYVDILRTLSEAELEMCSAELRAKALGLQASLGRRDPYLGGWSRTKNGFSRPAKTVKAKTPGQAYVKDGPSAETKTPLWIEHGGDWLAVSAEVAVIHSGQGRTVRMMTAKEMQDERMECVHG